MKNQKIINNKYYEYDESGGSNLGKWSERLNLMRKMRNTDMSFRDIGFNIVKIVLSTPIIVYNNIFNKEKIVSKKIVNSDKNKAVNGVLVDKKVIRDIDREYEKINDRDLDELIRLVDKNGDSLVSREEKINLIRGINTDELRKKSVDSKNKGVRKENKEIDNSLEKRKEKLQLEIVNLIKKKLVKNINELEMLQSDLYVIKELGSEDIYYKKCNEDIKEIKKMLTAVKVLKEKYDYLKDNVDFEYMLEYGDNLLIDKILELKDICSKSEIKATIDNYKILDEYKYLYLKIDKLEENIIKYDEYKNNKAYELKERDIDFDKFKDSLYNIDKEDNRYKDFVMKQNMLFDEMNEKINKIETYEVVNYRLKGFNQLVGNSFKYLGLLMASPLKGIMPSIATQTLITRNVIHNLYNNLEWVPDKKMVYEAIDYSDMINSELYNIDSILRSADTTLEDIVRLKRKYDNDFKYYEGNISEYKDVIKKLNKMENAILGNKLKMEMMKEKLKEKERENSNKLKLVHKMNSDNNS